MFCVIKIDQIYSDGYIENIECIKSFSLEEEAQNYLNDIKSNRAKLIQKRLQYIEDYVDKLELPKLNHEGWYEYVKSFPIGSNTSPKDFKDYLKRSLENKYQMPKQYTDYNPPLMPDMGELFIIECTNLKE